MKRHVHIFLMMLFGAAFVDAGPEVGSWKLTHWVKNAEPVKIEAKGTPELALDENGGAKGFASINRFFGKCSIKEGKITWEKAMGTTKKAGPAGLMNQERRFLRDLKETTRITVKNGTLILTSTDGKTVLKFGIQRLKKAEKPSDG